MFLDFLFNMSDYELDEETQIEYNANNTFDEEDSIFVEDNISSVNSNDYNNEYRLRKKQLEQLKKTDKDYYTTRLTVDNKKVKIEMYSTNQTPGYLIRDAITGARLPYRVGSKDEYLFFKVRASHISNGEDVVTLYYSSPEEYEKHQNTTISNETKEGWEYNRSIRKIEIEKMNRKRERQTIVH